MTKLTHCLLILCLIASAASAFGQGAATARVSGRVEADDGQTLPGVLITFRSDSLQGSRTSITDANGFYSAPGLPPGDYTISFQLDGFKRIEQRARLGAAQDAVVNTTMPLATVSEEIVVLGGAAGLISEGTSVSQTVAQDEIEQLPVSRTLTSSVSLMAGVHTTGPNDQITISGAQSWENLILLNGVTLNENIRGQPLSLFIEDAIQETTTATAAISAEYGRFTGGVVNAITKSGGNELSGSLRTSFANDDWTDAGPAGVERSDEINETYEVTIGGPLLRDRLWFFAAGRDFGSEETATTFFNEQYATGRDERRLEGKLTLTLGGSHTVQTAYTRIEDEQTNVGHGGLDEFVVVTDDGSIDPVRETPQRLVSLNYTGVLNQNLFVEANYSEREFTFEGSGGEDMNLTTGTPVWDFADTLVVYNESLFCGSCKPDEERNNENFFAKGSYFLTTEGLGSHELVLGVDTFDDVRLASNHQSPTDIMVWNLAPTIFDEEELQVFPVLNSNSLIALLPILEDSQGTRFTTNSAFLNDRWVLNDEWAFNVGLRYDENDFENSVGVEVSKSDEISPRLGVTFSPGGTGGWVFNASFGRYSGLLPNSVANTSSPGGVPATFFVPYLGAPVNTGGPPFLSSPEALDILFGWLFDVCPDIQSDLGSCPFLIPDDVPGLTTASSPGLRSPSADEYTVGVTRRLGTRGRLRVDLVHREWDNLFATRRDLSTGTVTTSEFGTPVTADLGLVTNASNDVLQREYGGLNVMVAYRLGDRLSLNGNYTWSNAEGNFDGETGGSGPVTSAALEYPEYKEARWAFPAGDLRLDQEHRLRAWAIYDLLRGERHGLNVSVLQSFFSGTPYEAISPISSGELRSFVDNPGYVNPVPSGVDYFFTRRGAFRTDDITRTDLSLNYTLDLGRFEVFVQPEVLNLFNEDGAVSVNTSVRRLESFDPFTETPVEGVHWEKGPDFGQPTEDDDYQQPRTYRFSVGFRF